MDDDVLDAVEGTVAGSDAVEEGSSGLVDAGKAVEGAKLGVVPAERVVWVLTSGGSVVDWVVTTPVVEAGEASVLQTRSVVAVGGASSMLLEGQTKRVSLQTRSEVRVGATDWYSTIGAVKVGAPGGSWQKRPKFPVPTGVVRGAMAQLLKQSPR